MPRFAFLAGEGVSPGVSLRAGGRGRFGGAPLAALGLEGRRTRREARVVYLKDSEQIVEALKEMGARKAIFEMENVRIVKGMRNRVNRLVNSETANVEKTVNAALAQLEAIRIIDEQVGLDSLPLPLRSLARLRLQHPYASLRELGELLTPKVSKSGVSYRMNQLMDRARKLAEAGDEARGAQEEYDSLKWND